jgi:hypothetical protein
MPVSVSSSQSMASNRLTTRSEGLAILLEGEVGKHGQDALATYPNLAVPPGFRSFTACLLTFLRLHDFVSLYFGLM